MDDKEYGAFLEQKKLFDNAVISVVEEYLKVTGRDFDYCSLSVEAYSDCVVVRNDSDHNKYISISRAYITSSEFRKKLRDRWVRDCDLYRFATVHPVCNRKAGVK